MRRAVKTMLANRVQRRARESRYLHTYPSCQQKPQNAARFFARAAASRAALCSARRIARRHRRRATTAARKKNVAAGGAGGRAVAVAWGDGSAGLTRAQR